MNANTKRFLLGALSSLLFSVGFARVADRLDPLTGMLPAASSQSVKPTDGCSMPCNCS